MNVRRRFGMNIRRRRWSVYVTHSGRWSPRVLFWSYLNKIFGATLVVAGLPFSFWLSSHLESVWRCPRVCLHNHEGPWD